MMMTGLKALVAGEGCFDGLAISESLLLRSSAETSAFLFLEEDCAGRPSPSREA